ncbi:MAG: hypothetical protein ACLP6E_10215 [Acidimicrobiales bacterium]
MTSTRVRRQLAYPVGTQWQSGGASLPRDRPNASLYGELGMTVLSEHGLDRFGRGELGDHD